MFKNCIFIICSIPLNVSCGLLFPSYTFMRICMHHLLRKYLVCSQKTRLHARKLQKHWPNVLCGFFFHISRGCTFHADPKFLRKQLPTKVLVGNLYPWKNAEFWLKSAGNSAEKSRVSISLRLKLMQRCWQIIVSTTQVSKSCDPYQWTRLHPRHPIGWIARVLWDRKNSYYAEIPCLGVPCKNNKTSTNLVKLWMLCPNSKHSSHNNISKIKFASGSCFQKHALW